MLSLCSGIFSSDKRHFPAMPHAILSKTLVCDSLQRDRRIQNDPDRLWTLEKIYLTIFWFLWIEWCLSTAMRFMSTTWSGYITPIPHFVVVQCSLNEFEKRKGMPWHVPFLPFFTIVLSLPTFSLGSIDSSGEWTHLELTRTFYHWCSALLSISFEGKIMSSSHFNKTHFSSTERHSFSWLLAANICLFSMLQKVPKWIHRF